MIIDSAHYTCSGGHEINEDSLLCGADVGVFAVADGLGGHSDGEKASAAAIRCLKEMCGGDYSESRITEMIENANTAVINYGDGGKTTVAAAFIENGLFHYVNVGDSRVYYFRKGKIYAVTKDHSVCQASVDMGLLRPEDIRGSEDRTRLLKVLGNEEHLNLKKHYQPIVIENGDAFLICSDGFWEYVYESEAEGDLLKSDSAEKWLKYMLKRHIARAENKGDNYTAVCGMIYLDESEIPPVKSRKLPLLPILLSVLGALIIVGVLLLAAQFQNCGSTLGDSVEVFGAITEESTVAKPLEPPREITLGESELIEGIEISKV